MPRERVARRHAGRRGRRLCRMAQPPGLSPSAPYALCGWAADHHLHCCRSPSITFVSGFQHRRMVVRSPPPCAAARRRPAGRPEAWLRRVRPFVQPYFRATRLPGPAVIRPALVALLGSGPLFRPQRCWGVGRHGQCGVRISAPIWRRVAAGQGGLHAGHRSSLRMSDDVPPRVGRRHVAWSHRGATALID